MLESQYDHDAFLQLSKIVQNKLDSETVAKLIQIAKDEEEFYKYVENLSE